jgi:hypothetical protein
MASWGEFEQLRPDMAATFRDLLKIPIAYLATVRKDGSPRVHPVCPIFADGKMYVAMNETSPKRFDLTPEGRYAMHAANPEPKDGRGDDEFYITGRAWRVGDEARTLIAGAAGHTVHESDWLFEFDIDYAMSAIWENWGRPATYAVRKRWSASGGVTDDDPGG